MGSATKDIEGRFTWGRYWSSIKSLASASWEQIFTFEFGTFVIGQGLHDFDTAYLEATRGRPHYTCRNRLALAHGLELHASRWRATWAFSYLADLSITITCLAIISHHLVVLSRAPALSHSKF